MHEPERATIAPQKRGRSVPLIGCMPSENGSAPRGCGARGRVGMLLELIMPRTTDLDPEIAEHIVVTTCGARAASLAELRALRALPPRQAAQAPCSRRGGAAIRGTVHVRHERAKVERGAATTRPSRRTARQTRSVDRPAGRAAAQ